MYRGKSAARVQRGDCGRGQQMQVRMALGAVVVAIGFAFVVVLGTDYAVRIGWLPSARDEQAKVWDVVLDPEHRKSKYVWRGHFVQKSAEAARKVAAERMMCAPEFLSVRPCTENYIDTLSLQIMP
jgi:hypothetical protein